MINSRKISDLHPVMQAKCNAHIRNCLERGVTIIPTSTLRDDEYQATLYAQGRTKKGSIVTNLKVTGAHGLGLAYDVVPIVNRKAVWNDSRLWSIIGEEGKKLGLVWGGDWTKLVDKPHFELTDKIPFTELRAGKRPEWFNTKELSRYVQIRTRFQTDTIDYLLEYKYAEPLITRLVELL